MMFKTSLITGALAATLLALSGAAALAAPTISSQSIVYDAPHGEETDTIDKGDTVRVSKCEEGFCLVHDLDDTDTDAGWVRVGNIDFAGRDQGDDDTTADDTSNGLVHLMFSDNDHDHKKEN